MGRDENDGKRVGLGKDASYVRQTARYLTDEQIAEGPQGVVVRSASEGGGAFLDVKFENVPGERRVPAAECQFLWTRAGRRSGAPKTGGGFTGRCRGAD